MLLILDFQPFHCFQGDLEDVGAITRLVDGVPQIFGKETQPALLVTTI